jgi:hypothetical protein
LVLDTAANHFHFGVRFQKWFVKTVQIGQILDKVLKDFVLFELENAKENIDKMGVLWKILRMNIFI